MTPVALACALMLHGCALFQNSVNAPPAIETMPMAESPNANDTPTEDPNAKLPKVELTDELLYKILTAEIALQRGNWESAYITILSVAQQTRDPRLARRAAEIALSVKQGAEALTATKLWRELDPSSNEATQMYLSFMLLNNNLTEIKNTFSERLIAAKPNQYGVIMLQAQRLLANAKDKAAAFSVLEQIVEPYKNTSEAHMALAQGAYHRGNSVRAIAEAKEALRTKPDSQLAILTIAQASAPEDATATLADFLVRNPQARDVRLAYASLLIDAKQLDKASAQFEILLHDKPDDISNLYTLGVLAMQRNLPQQAETYFNAYLKAAEGHSIEEEDLTKVYLNLAQIAELRHDHAAAQAWLAKVNFDDGKNVAWVSTQIRRAVLLAKEGDVNGARELLKSVQANSADDQVQLIEAETEILRDAKRVDEAMTVLQQGMIDFPDNVDLLYTYGMLADAQEKYEEMETAFKRVIELTPENPNAYNALGYSYADRNIHLDQAYALIEKAVQLSKDDAYILDSWGWVNFRLSKMDEAEQALRKAYQVRQDVEIAAHLGEVLLARGKTAEAKQIWREGLKKDANNPTLKSTLQRLGFPQP